MRKKIAVWKGKIKKGIFPNCFLCGKPITQVKDLTCEHLTPKSRGGSNEDCNLYPAHTWCNWEKGSMTLREYVEFLKNKEKERND